MSDAKDEYLISARTKLLRDEIRSIQEQEQLFRGKRYHSAADVMAHASRKLRLITIAAEMEKLLQNHTATDRPDGPDQRRSELAA